MGGLAEQRSQGLALPLSLCSRCFGVVLYSLPPLLQCLPMLCLSRAMVLCAPMPWAVVLALVRLRCGVVLCLYVRNIISLYYALLYGGIALKIGLIIGLI